MDEYVEPLRLNAEEFDRLIVELESPPRVIPELRAMAERARERELRLQMPWRYGSGLERHTR
jgi:hypothetical protein